MNQNGYEAVSLFSAGTRRFQAKGNRLAPLHLAVRDGRALADMRPLDGSSTNVYWSEKADAGGIGSNNRPCIAIDFVRCQEVVYRPSQAQSAGEGKNDLDD